MVSGHPKSRSPVGPFQGPHREDHGERQVRPALVLVAVATFLFALVGLNARATYGAQVTSDEPQYLLTALSLAEDLDLDISDELADERFRDFHEIPLNPQTIELNTSGQRLSPHDPGLPLLLAGPMKLGGWRLAKVALAVIAAATATLTTWVAIRRFGVAVRTASVVVVGLFLSPPLTSYATQVYPEMAAALAVTVGLVGLAGSVEKDSLTGQRVTAAVVAIVVLPWLSIKYAPVALVLAIAFAVAMGRERRGRGHPTVPALFGVGVLVLSAVIYLVVHQRVYGGWTVYATGDHFVDGEFRVVGNDPDYVGRSQRLIALLIDRGYGLAAWAPAYLVSVPALAFAARARHQGAALLACLSGAGWAVATWVALTMHGWWWPGRQVVVVLPAVAIIMAMYIDRRPKLLRIFAVLSALAACNWLWVVVEASTGRRTLVVDFAETASPLYRLWAPLLPDYRRFAGGDLVLTCLWSVVLVLLALLGWRQARAASMPEV